MAVLPGPSESLARRPSGMTSLHGRLLLMMPPIKKPGAVDRPGTIRQFQFSDSTIRSALQEFSCKASGTPRFQGSRAGRRHRATGSKVAANEQFMCNESNLAQTIARLPENEIFRKLIANDISNCRAKCAGHDVATKLGRRRRQLTGRQIRKLATSAASRPDGSGSKELPRRSN
jgi:hypothetical protein